MAQQLGTVIFGVPRDGPDGLTASDKRAGIIGAGSAGLFALQLARLAGFEEIVVADLEASRLDMAKRLGATHTVLAPDQSFVEAAAEMSGGAGLDLVIEAAGFDDCRSDCIAAARYLGRVGYFGLPEHGEPVLFPFSQAFRSGATIEMAGFAQLEPGLTAFREAVQFLEDGRIDVDMMLEPCFGLEQIQEAMETARDRRAIKVSIDLRD